MMRNLDLWGIPFTGYTTSRHSHLILLAIKSFSVEFLDHFVYHSNLTKVALVQNHNSKLTTSGAYT